MAIILKNSLVRTFLKIIWLLHFWRITPYFQIFKNFNESNNVFDIIIVVLFSNWTSYKTVHFLLWCLQVHPQRKLLVLSNSSLILNITWIKEIKNLGNYTSWSKKRKKSLVGATLALLGFSVALTREPPDWARVPESEALHWLVATGLYIDLSHLWLWLTTGDSCG